MFIYNHIQPTTPFLPPPHSYPGTLLGSHLSLGLPASELRGCCRYHGARVWLRVEGLHPCKSLYCSELSPPLPAFVSHGRQNDEAFPHAFFLLSAICILSAPHWQLYSTAQRRLLSFHEQCHPREITQGRQAGGDRFQPQKGCNKSLRGGRRKHIKMTECTLIGVGF